ncbi:DUF3592 domain-containing protein [Aquimarina macrocephali]|uniref:DUF3592 domain-containing protein n=1 Tax=Aquimarina macrocephali TaxID=666563 RepID=UPI0004646C4D|nr:DUF3592 domain-containing protein [Aquimarina macrocephali]
MKMIEYLYTGMLITAIVLVYFAIKQYYNSKELIATGVKTKAKVIDLIQISGDDGYTYKPVFEYTDRSNNLITFKSEISSSPAPYDIGDIVNIVYDTNNEDRKIVSFWGLYRWTIILLAIASPLLIIGGGYLLYARG